MRMWIAVLMAAACSKPTPVPSPPPPVTPLADAADPGATPIDAAPLDAPTDAPAPDAPPAFRAFVPPEPMTVGIPTPRSTKCRENGHEDAERERAREMAAIDIELRKQGSMLLPVQVYAGPAEHAALVRGAQGEQLLVVKQGQFCGRPPTTFVALAKNGEVFEVRPTFSARRTRKVSVCEPVCPASCGMPQRATTTLVAEVPAGARLVAPQKVTIPMEVKVELHSVDAKGQPKRCKMKG